MKTIQSPSADYQTLVMELVESRNIIEKFINSCSHSLRGPLKTIKGLAYVLEKNNQSESETRKLLKLIDHTAFKMEGVLTQLEQFLQNSRNEIAVESLDLNQLVGEVIREHRESLEARFIDVAFEVEQDQPFVSDQNKIRLILSQIISNAIQFYDNEKARRFIKIKVSVLSSSCEISILDNGIGISHESQDKIFKPFYRGSEKSQGPGIGLYIAREAIEKIGGRISVDSRQHLGSKFFLWVPSQAA
ncbi:MAG TPA: HAMP domain-containing sensor histidine kinase [Cyclobacteriaceae bacterium]|nr:HAMP domain-containing sensor histidine kinase [Cyclobacteriaceae bacterium]